MNPKKTAATFLIAVVVSLLCLAPRAAAFNEFSVQRGQTVIPDGDLTLTLLAGTDYVAPVGPAFVRITGTRLSGMGRTSGGGKQNADRWMVWLSDAGNPGVGFTLRRYGSQGDNRVTWELVEYVGAPAGANAISVRDVLEIEYTEAPDLTVSGPAVPGVVDDDDVVVLITGQAADASTDTGAHQGMNTAEWDAANGRPVFRRGGAGVRATVSYVVIEFTGTNWSAERIEHIYSAAGVPETESISLVPGVDHTFFHAQHRSGGARVDEQGAEVWLSIFQEITFELESSAPDPGAIATVAWVVANREMTVHHYSGVRLPDVFEEDVWTQTITSSTPSISSILGESARCAGTDEFPRGSIVLRVLNDTTIELRQSDTGTDQTYRFSVVQWPDPISTSVGRHAGGGRVILGQNVPNPFNPFTTIAFEVTGETAARMAVYDIGGRVVAVLIDEPAVPAGRHEVRWNGRDSRGQPVSTGVYFYRLEAGGTSQTRKMVLLK